MPPNPHSAPLGREARNKTYRGTDQHYTHHHKQWDWKNRENSPQEEWLPDGRDAVLQEDQQGHNGPEQGGSTAAPEELSWTEWSVTRSYALNGDDGSARSRLQDLRTYDCREEVHSPCKWTAREKSCWHSLGWHRRREPMGNLQDVTPIHALCAKCKMRSAQWTLCQRVQAFQTLGMAPDMHIVLIEHREQWQCWHTGKIQDTKHRPHRW